MGRLVKIIVWAACFAVAVAATTFSASAQLVQIAQGASTAAAISEIGNAIKALIGRAESAGDYIMLRAGQEGLYLLDGFEKANKDILETAFDRISDERRALVNQINDTMGTLSRQTDLTLDRAESMIDQITDVAMRVTFNSYPVIFRTKGSIVVPGENLPVSLVINGANLNDEEPVFEFAGKQFPVKRVSTRELVIDLPRDLFEHAESELKSVYGTLSIDRKYGGLFGFFESSEVVAYSVGIGILPRALASVEVTYAVGVEDREERSFAEEVNYNSSSRDWDCRHFAYNPSTAERRFDVSKSSVTPTSGNSRGEVRDVSVRDVGISFAICAKRRLTDRDNGFRHALVQYVEYWMVPRDEERTVEAQPLGWLEPTVIQIPADAKKVLVTVRSFTNATEVRGDSGSAGKFASVQLISDQGNIIVRPVIPPDVR